MWEKIGLWINIVAGLCIIIEAGLKFWPRIPIAGSVVMPGTGKVGGPPVLLLIAIALLMLSTFLWMIRPKDDSKLGTKNYHFETIADRTFRNETVVLDGKEFIRCKFINVTAVFNGTAPVRLMTIDMNGILFTTHDKRIESAIALLKGFGLLNPSIDLSGVPVESPKFRPSPPESMDTAPGH